MKKRYLSIIILLSLNVQAEYVFKSNPKGYQGALVIDPLFSESDFVFKEYNPLPWIELERSSSNFTPLILNQTTNFIQNGTDTILQERTIKHIYTNTKINQDVVKELTKEQQTISEPSTRNVFVQKTNTLETENKSNCTEWTPLSDTKYTDENVEQTQECDVQTIDTYSYSINGNVVEQKDINGIIKKTFEQEINGTKPLVFNSCKEILDAGRSNGNGDYTLNVNGSTKNVYCDMSDGGWTLLYSFGNSNKSAFIATGLDSIQKINNTSGLFIDANYFGNTYREPEDIVRLDYFMFFNAGEPNGFLNINTSKNNKLKIEYGHPYKNNNINSSCNVFLNGSKIDYVQGLSHKTLFVNNNSSKNLKFEEQYTASCALRDVYFQ